MAVNPRIVAGGVAAIIALGASVAAKYEGLVLGAYKDPVNIVTACRGHTGPDVKMGQQYTLEQCDKWFQEDLKEAYEAVHQCVRVPLSNEEAGAYTSFVYNVGGSAFCGSTLVRKLNQGDHVGACNELPKWVYARSIKLPGLVKRRAAERDLCLSFNKPSVE